MADYVAPAGNAVAFETVSLPYSAPDGANIQFSVWSSVLDISADFGLDFGFDASAGLANTVSAGFAPQLSFTGAAGLAWPVAANFDLSLDVSAGASLTHAVHCDVTLGFAFAAAAAESWYVLAPFGSSVRMPWSPQERIERSLSAPMTQPPRKDSAKACPWGKLEEIAATVAGIWAAVPTLDREGPRVVWDEFAARPETSARDAWTAPPPKDRERISLPWDDLAELDRAAGMLYTAPPKKDRERISIPWGDFDPLDRAAELPWTQPPPKDVEFTIVSGPKWYPRWCIRQYVPPDGLALDFAAASTPEYRPPHGLALDFNDISANYPQVCFDGTWSGPTDNYWYRPHPWEIPIVIPRRFYVVLNTVTLKRVADNVPIPITGMEIGTDMDAWAWTLRATLRRAVDLDLVRPVAGVPVEVEASINGNIWRFVVEEFGDERRFGQRGFSISGRSLSAYLAAPYSDPEALIQTSQMTAAQLADEALLYTGFDKVFTLDDWLVPGGVFASNNQTPMQQLIAIAAAAGGVVHSDPAATTVRMLPWYAAMPWQWGAVTVDAVLPTWQERRARFEPRPQYSGVYVSGQTQGVTCFVKRTGTDGSRQPQMHTDALITATESGLALGKKILADSGPRAIESISAPLLDNPGLLTPGMIIEITDPAGNWRGQVIRTAISAQRPTVVQSIDVLRYYGS